MKSQSIVLARSMGAIDLHFHGAYGIDLMRAQNPELDELSRRLGAQGVAGFCPTTLSVRSSELASSVERLGRWISRVHKIALKAPLDQAIPLGIHLEGPFINTACCGAHPPELIRRLDFKELETLWEASQNHLKIVTIAPELLEKEELDRLVKWARLKKITLSIGHSRATEEQARIAFKAGFRGITHAWNALPFHQRAPGPIAAAFASKESYIEIIIDQVHVAPSVVALTEKLQGLKKLCYVSDCVPAAEVASGIATSFGPLKIEYLDGACRLPGGALAGGGKVLSHAFLDWIQFGTQDTKELKSRLKSRLICITQAPLSAIDVSSQIQKLLHPRETEWTLEPSGRLACRSLFSSRLLRRPASDRD